MHSQFSFINHVFLTIEISRFNFFYVNRCILLYIASKDKLNNSYYLSVRIFIELSAVCYLHRKGSKLRFHPNPPIWPRLITDIHFVPFAHHQQTDLSGFLLLWFTSLSPLKPGSTSQDTALIWSIPNRIHPRPTSSNCQMESFPLYLFHVSPTNLCLNNCIPLFNKEMEEACNAMLEEIEKGNPIKPVWLIFGRISHKGKLWIGAGPAFIKKEHF